MKMGKKRWVFVVAVAVIGLVIGVVFGYLAGVAVVLGVITVGIFYAFGATAPSEFDRAEQTGRNLAADQERREAKRANRREGRCSK
jgi:hypothetical protein